MKDKLTSLIEINNILDNSRSKYSVEDEVLIVDDNKTLLPTLEKWKTKAIVELYGLKQEETVTKTINLLFDLNEYDLDKTKEIVNNLKSINTNLNDLSIRNIYDVGSIRKNVIIKTAYDEYKLIDKIGEGGNGFVYKASSKNNEIVAIKFLKKSDTAKIKRFKNEIHFCEKYEHENIVKIIDRGYTLSNEEDIIFYVMPFYEDTLRKRINDGIPHDKIVEVFVGLINGLIFAHNKDTIHRDIKPENILFNKDSWNPVICDFGIAHFSDNDKQTLIKTKVRDKMGNYAYSAPEQINHKDICPETDIYAAGLILNEMFTKEIPNSSGYKRIEQVDYEYKYLDDLFEEIYKYNPSERIKEDKIINEINILSEIHVSKRKKEKIEHNVPATFEPERFDLKITSIMYENKELIFSFDNDIPNDWYQIIAFGEFSCTQICGYERCLLNRRNSNELTMAIKDRTSLDTIRNLKSYMYAWVKSSNEEYNRELLKKAIEKQRKEEENRRKELEELSRKIEINKLLSSIND